MIPRVALHYTSMNYLPESTLITGLLKYRHAAAGAKFLTHGGSQTHSCQNSVTKNAIVLAYPNHIHIDLYPNLILLTVPYFCVIQDQPHYYMFPTEC